MERLEEIVASVQRRLNEKFVLSYEVGTCLDRVQVRCLNGEMMGAACLLFICGLGAKFVSCYYDGRHLWAVFDVAGYCDVYLDEVTF